MNKTLGLTLGKFAPFHKGHQYLIETAIQETSHVIVVIYDALEVTSIPLKVRAGWIRKLYPSVEVIEGCNGPTQMGDSPEIEKIQEDYILGLLGGRKVTHFFSSELYGKHMSRALGAINRQVDVNRFTIPISGTLVRQSPLLYRNYLSPIVYRDLIKKVVFLGAPSTGKTTMASEMAKVFNTSWMPEYGREYWEKNQVNRRLTLEQILEIAEGHLEREEALLNEANNYLFCDTNAITTYMFSMSYHKKALDPLTNLARCAETRYDLVFLCDTDIPYDDTWDRSGEVSREIFQSEIIHDLQERNVPYIVLSGNLTERIEKVKLNLLEFVYKPTTSKGTDLVLP